MDQNGLNFSYCVFCDLHILKNLDQWFFSLKLHLECPEELFLDGKPKIQG